MRRSTVPVSALALVFGMVVASCSSEVEIPRDGPMARVASPLWIWNPISKLRLVFDLVGHGLNGQGLTGKVLDGRFVVGVSLDSVALVKGQPRSVKLAGTAFSGGGLGRGGKDLVGTRFSAALDDGDVVELRVDGVVAPAADPLRPFTRYLVSYSTEAGPKPLCGVDDAGAPILAIPLNGRWDYRIGADGGGAFIADERSFTFACEGYVLAKCVEMGYPPWAAGKLCDTQGKGAGKCVKTTLQAWHQACTRMLRADYCGDGTSYTQDGVLVNVFDGIGLRGDTEDWLFEAEWDEQGARCAVRERLPDQPEVSCQARLVQPECGTSAHFQTGALIMSEVMQ